MINKVFNTTLCCIAKCENHYLKEWVDYHLDIGFTHIYIYDNNDIDGERIEPLFNNYNNVTVLDCRGKIKYQESAYTEFYHRFGLMFDWIAYIDVDEFLTFSEKSGIHTIDEFLHTFDNKDVDVIQLNWMCYGDNDLVCTDSFSVLNRFVKPLPYDIKIGDSFCKNDYIKSIYRGKLIYKRVENISLNWCIGAHTCNGLGELTFVDAKGEKCGGYMHKPYDFSVAYLRHFYTKTIVEWIIKKSRGRANGRPTEWTNKYSFDSFFDINKRTEEKERIIKCYEIFRDVLSVSENSDIAFVDSYRANWDKMNKKYRDANKRYEKVLQSKAYRLGKFILRPFSWIKNIIG